MTDQDRRLVGFKRALTTTYPPSSKRSARANGPGISRSAPQIPARRSTVIQARGNRAPKSSACIQPSIFLRSMSLLKTKGFKKPSTILHAVPENAESSSSSHPKQQDTTAHDDRHVSDKTSPALDKQVSPAISHSLSKRAKHTHAISYLISGPDLHAVRSSNSLKGAIGTYRHGRTHRRPKDSALTNETRPSVDKNARPKIRVVIPSRPVDRPLPSLPFFDRPSKPQTSIEPMYEMYSDISPPSATTKLSKRSSIVSPLSLSQSMPKDPLQRSVTLKGSKSSRAANQRHNSSESGNSSNDSHESDSASTYSNNSSKTSIDLDCAHPIKDSERRPHAPYSIQSLTATKHLDAPPKPIQYTSPPSTAPPRQYTHHSPDEGKSEFTRSCSLRPAPKPTGALVRQPTITRGTSKRSRRRSSVASSSNMGVIHEALSRSASKRLPNPFKGGSPTLSEAENELNEQLTTIAEDRTTEERETDKEPQSASAIDDAPFKWDEVITRRNKNAEQDLPVIEETPSPPPQLPRKSSKRLTALSTEAYRLSHRPSNCTLSKTCTAQSKSDDKALSIVIPEYKGPAVSAGHSPIEVLPTSCQTHITPRSAELVILRILQSLDHLDDLFSMAIINRGFYRVFKRHELSLIKLTLRKMSPAAWEFREVAFPGHDQLHDEDLEMTRPQEEYTPTTYIELQRRDVLIVKAIKTLIQQKCQSFVRPEISIAMGSDDPADTARVDGALWRIWTFCKIFGSGKDREEDVVAQMDWLRGGLLVNQPTCTFSIVSTDYMNDTFVSVPECFAKGNEGGLTAEQLFDMMELWNCLGVLLQGFEGRTTQAREFGIYENTEIRGGDIDGEEMMLDEWCYYLLTFGLSAILGIAKSTATSSEHAFKTAMENGWIHKWKPPIFNGSRRNFLKEATSRVYEDKIANTYALTSTRDVQRHLSKQRIQKHINELRHRKTSGEHLAMVRMSQERPISEWDAVIDNLTRRQPAPRPTNNIASYIPTIRSSLAPDLSVPIAELPASRTPPPRPESPPRRTIAEPLLPTPPPSTVPSVCGYNTTSHPTHRNTPSIPPAPPLPSHPAFRNNPPPTSPARPHHLHHRQNSDLSTSSYSSGTSTASHSRSRTAEHPAFAQHPAQRNIYASGTHENTADKAIYRIVEMGFTADQAREALRMTDLGNGLRVDRAVELLLSRQRFGGL